MGKNGNIHPTRIFKSEDDLKDAWMKYKEALTVEGQKWQKVQYVGREGERKTDAQKVPLTLEGFKRYCRENYGDIEQYFSNKDHIYDDFVGICSYIRQEIREDQIIGGLLGFYNPSITQRLNGLTEKVSTEVKGSLSIPNLPDIGDRK